MFFDHNKHKVRCRCGVEGPFKKTIDDAIAAWNALPRAPEWVTYDGTESTLPPDGSGVIVTWMGVVQEAFVRRCGDTWDFGEDVDALGISVGDRWMPWPEDNNGK